MSCCGNSPIKLPYNAIEPGWNDSLVSTCNQSIIDSNAPITTVADPFTEWINYNLIPGVLTQVIPFTVTKASNNIADKGLRIFNTVDVQQIIVNFNIVSTTNSNMTILLSSTVDTTNYYLKGLISIIG